MTTFSKLWDTEVKQLAEACVSEPKFIRLMCKGENYQMNDEEKEYFKKTLFKYKDLCGMYYISDMIWQVEHALADGRQYVAEFAISQIYSCLNSPSYFQNVFNGNEDSEEWKARVALRDGLHKLLYAD